MRSANAGNETVKKHVLFITYHLPQPGEPGAFRPWMEARLLADAGFRVTVITSGVHYMTGKSTRRKGGWCTEETIQGIRILKTWAPTNHRRSILRRILNYLSYAFLSLIGSVLKVGDVDFVFAGTDPILTVPMVFGISLLKGAPMVLDERDLYPETAVALGVLREGLLTRAAFGFQQFIRKRARGILAATPGIRSQLVSYGHPERKVKLLYNADAYLDTDGPQRSAVRDLRIETGKQFLIGYAGGLGRANHVWTLIKAAEKLSGELPLGFVIIGSGEMQQTYVDYCQQHAMDSVFFYSAVPRQDARLLLEQMDVCIQPLPRDKHFSHTLTSKTFDYHGLGKPMIFCGQGDTVKLLAESGGGIAVGPEDDDALASAIIHLWHDDFTRQRMGASARMWFRNHIGSDAACTVIRAVIETSEM